MSEAARAARPDPRITRRRKAIERSRKKRLLIAVSCVGALALLAWTAFWSPLLTVRTVRVTGSKHVTGVDVERAAHLGADTNVLLVSTGSVARAVERLPWVKKARVDRSLPGTLRVRVVERSPVVVLAAGSGRWLVDRSGFVIAEAARGRHRLPTLAGIHSAALRPGMRLTPGGGRGALAVWRALPPHLKHKVVAVFAPTPVALTFTLRDGVTVRYGPPRDMKDKNHVLLALLHRLSATGTQASYIDVRVPTSPALGPAPGAAPPVTPTAGSTPTPGATPTATASPTPARSPSPSPSQ